MDLFSSLVQVARGQLDDLMQIMAEDRQENGGVNQRDNSGNGTIPADLDPSVSHDTFRFFQNVVEDRAYARSLFLSYNKMKKTMDKDTSFAMSKQQSLHARSIIRAIPALDQLRFELCPSLMQDNQFWAIYFDLAKERNFAGAAKDENVANRSGPQSEHFGQDVSNYSEEEEETTGNYTPLESQGKDEGCDLEDEDLNKGIKRERENENSSFGFSDDIAIVSRLLYNGAKKTLQYAEQFIEAVDERAGSGRAGVAEPCVHEEGNEEASSSPNSTLNSGDTKRSKRSSSNFKESTAVLRTTDRIPPRSQDSGFDTDGLSVSSMEDSDLKDWSRVRSSSRSGTADDGYELI